MTVPLIILLILLVVVALFLLAMGMGYPVLEIFGLGGQGASSPSSSMRAMVQNQRTQSFVRPEGGERKTDTVFTSASQSKVDKVADSRLTLEKRLKYAQWKLPPLVFRLLIVGITILVFGIVQTKLNIIMQLISLSSGWLIMNGLLNRSMDKRFLAFDSDYPAFLLSMVGLLKTGMNLVTAMSAAVETLENGSLLKLEVELMIERLRLGVNEDQSIGNFGEDIYHPEIELFVQALLLNRRVGGNLSDTLDRLARQVRKRQQFRQSAVSSVGMQRGSIWLIIIILIAIEGYIYFVMPEMVLSALKNPTGFQVYQVGLTLIILGIYWVRQVTKIKV